jgi:hypothetical protein
MHKTMLLDHRHAAALAHGQKSGEDNQNSLYLPFLDDWRLNGLYCRSATWVRVG